MAKTSWLEKEKRRVATVAKYAAVRAELFGGTVTGEGDFSLIKSKPGHSATVHLAGRPGDQETALVQAGVKSFIFMGCDVVSTLQAAHDILALK